MYDCACGKGEACNICGGDTVGRLLRDIEKARRILASDVKNIYCRQALILLDETMRKEKP